MNVLNSWKILKLKTSEGEVLVCLEGRVYGSNPRFPSSSCIRTSQIVGYSFESDSMVVTTRRGSEYLLGKPDPGQTFAQQRLIRYLDHFKKTPQSTFNEFVSQIIPSPLSECREDAPERDVVSH